MRKVLCGGLLCVLIGMGLGCENGKMHWPWDKKDKAATTQMSAKDDCPMCPGVQTANADGTCPKCGAKVK